MTELQVKTRGNTSLKGKPRVYFCAHPQDTVFFEEICADIFKTQNCAIYYKKDASQPLEDETVLGEIQLFVLPVTARFLQEESEAKKEFFFAVERHIPVLPLMQETGLEALFGEVCGDLQFLDKRIGDITAISFEEKLKNYLAAVLIGDELAEKIRSAFDAYIFLSYRKKDRKYAQELMRLIHKNEFCRDIAIWYDEFLTPGENFNNAIEEALKKSGLFALVVTPNLVSEPNYVQTVEYPMARSAGKKMFPAELLPTDRYALSEKFTGLEDPINALDDEAFTEALLRVVKTLALRERDASPEHNYFIGLAYLSGVDVEVDLKRAVELITKSALDGCLEAVGKLADMHRAGEGVEKSLKKAIEWQTLLTDALEKFYVEAKTEKDRKLYAGEFALAAEKLGEYHYDNGDSEASKAAYYKVRQVAEDLDRDSMPPARLSLLYRRMADIFSSEGKASKALHYYLKGVETEEALLKESGENTAGSRLLAAYLQAASSYRDNGFFNESRQLYRKVLLGSGELEALALAEAGLGETEWEEECYAEAELHFLRAIEGFGRFLKENEQFSARLQKCYALARACETALLLGKKSEARQRAKSATELAEYLVIEYGGLEAERALALAYSAEGKSAFAYGDLDGAKGYLTEAFLIFSKLATEKETIRSRSDLAFAYEGLAEVSDERERRGLLENALTVWEKLAVESPIVVRHKRQRDKIRLLLK